MSEYTNGIEGQLEINEDIFLNREIGFNKGRIKNLMLEIDMAYKYHSHNKVVMKFATMCEFRINMILGYNYKRDQKRNKGKVGKLSFFAVCNCKTFNEIAELAIAHVGVYVGESAKEHFANRVYSPDVQTAEDLKKVLEYYLDLNLLIISEP